MLISISLLQPIESPTTHRYMKRAYDVWWAMNAIDIPDYSELLVPLITSFMQEMHIKRSLFDLHAFFCVIWTKRIILFSSHQLTHTTDNVRHNSVCEMSNNILSFLNECQFVKCSQHTHTHTQTGFVLISPHDCHIRSIYIATDYRIIPRYLNMILIQWEKQNGKSTVNVSCSRVCVSVWVNTCLWMDMSGHLEKLFFVHKMSAVHFI